MIQHINAIKFLPSILYILRLYILRKERFLRHSHLCFNTKHEGGISMSTMKLSNYSARTQTNK